MFSCVCWHLKLFSYVGSAEHKTDSVVHLLLIREDIWDRAEQWVEVCLLSYLYDEAFVVAAAALWYQLVFEAAAFLIQLHHRVLTSRRQDRSRSSRLQTHAERENQLQALHPVYPLECAQELMFPQSKTSCLSSPFTSGIPPACWKSEKEQAADIQYLLHSLQIPMPITAN